MKNTEFVCPQCGKMVMGSGNENNSLNCENCGKHFNIQNFNNIVNPENYQISNAWFYKYDNGDIRAGFSKRSIGTAVVMTIITIVVVIYEGLNIHFIKEFSIGALFIFFKDIAFIGVVLFLILYIIIHLFGRMEIFIGEESYSFFGIFNYGIKKKFQWKEIKKIGLEKKATKKDKPQAIFLFTDNFKVIKITNILLKHEEVDYLIEILRYIVKRFYNHIELPKQETYSAPEDHKTEQQKSSPDTEQNDLAISYPEGYVPKKWTTAIILLIFLGFTGAHRFYVGKIKTGVLMIIVTIVTLGLGGFIWFFIDFYSIASHKFTDKNGYKLKQLI